MNDNNFKKLIAFGCAFMAWLRTTEVMFYIAPKNYFTFSGIELQYAYAAINAAMIEGTLLVILGSFAKQRSSSGWLPMVISSFILFALSFSAQGIDAAILTDSIDKLPEWSKVLLQWILPSAAIIMLAFLHLPDIFGTGDNVDSKPTVKTRGSFGTLYDNLFAKINSKIAMPKGSAESPKAQPPKP